MRHLRVSKKYSRNSKDRKNLIRGLVSSLIENGKIETTKVKALLLRREIDKMITNARSIEGLAERRLYARLPNKKLVQKMIAVILPNFGDKKSGFTTLVRLGVRIGDNSGIVRVEWSGLAPVVVPEPEKPKKETKKKTISKK